MAVAPRRRPITVDERTGVLHPDRLDRFAAGWIAPDPRVASVVDHYWHVSWRLQPDEHLDQPIIDLPAINLTIETGDVPAPLVITGVHRRAWHRVIHGSGTVFGIRLRPAGLAVLSTLVPPDVADATVAVTPDLDPGLHRLMQTVRSAESEIDRAESADRAIAAVLDRHPVSTAGHLANDVLDELRRRVRHRAGAPLAQRFDTSERTVQRSLAATLGHGPKWISSRIRLQEVARALAGETADLSAIAVDLGYADQSHLTSDFRRVTGLTPHAYRQMVRATQALQ